MLVDSSRNRKQETPNGEFLELYLKNVTVRKSLQNTATKEDVLEVFKEHGGTYE